MGRSFFLVCLLGLILLSGCATNFREASPETVAKSVKRSPLTDGKTDLWQAPELEISHYRTSFGGYNTVNYKLVADKAPMAQKDLDFQLWIYANYGGKSRHYAVAKFADGSTRELHGQRHVTERCQEFSNMVNACIYLDSAAMTLSRAELENARRDGLKLTLGSGSEDCEQIDLPGNYVQGFLDAVK